MWCNYTYYCVITINVLGFFLFLFFFPFSVLAVLYSSVCHHPLVSVSISFCFSFQVGDLVLIILDERHDNYVLFTVGPTLYFLHSESLTALDLKPGQPHLDLL